MFVPAGLSPSMVQSTDNDGQNVAFVVVDVAGNVEVVSIAAVAVGGGESKKNR